MPQYTVDPKLPKVNFEDIEAFVAVAYAGSFRLAATRMNLAQPTITTRIQRLEDTLGLKLFSRTTRRVLTTEAGARFLVPAERLVCDLLEMVQNARDEAEFRSGRLGIGSSPSLAETMVVPLVRTFMDKHPGVRVHLVDDFHSLLLEKLRTSEIELAILPMDGSITDIEAELLFVEDLLFAAPRRFDLATNRSYTFDEIAMYPFVTMPSPSAIRTTLFQAFANAGMSFRPVLEARSLGTLLGLVDSGVGLTLAPRKMLEDAMLENVDLIRVTDLQLQRHVCLVTVHGRALSPAASRFAAMVKSALREPSRR